MLHSNLGYPFPKIARIVERRDCDRSERGRRKWREEGFVLPGDDGRLLPIQVDGSRSQSRYSRGDTIRNAWKATGEIEVNISSSAGTSKTRPKHFKADFRLAQRCTEGSIRVT